MFNRHQTRRDDAAARLGSGYGRLGAGMASAAR